MGVTSYEKNGRVYWKIDTWLKQSNGTLHRVRMSKLPTQEHAEMLLAKLKLDSFEGTFFQKRLEGEIRVAECWEAWKPITMRDNDSWRSDIIRAKAINRLLGQHRAALLTRADIEAYRQRRFAETTFRGGPPSPATVDRELALLKRCINYMVECGRLTRNPISSVPLLNVPNTRDMVFKDTMLERILKAAPPAFAPVIEFDRETGMRANELRYLRWNQIDLTLGCIRLSEKETKTDRARVIYLTSRALQILKETPRQLHSPYVFVNPDTGKPWKEHNKMLKRACERVGVTGVVFHDLRRTFVTNSRRAGVPESVIMKLTGHRTRSVFDRYNIIDEEDLKAAVETIDRARASAATRQGIDQKG